MPTIDPVKLRPGMKIVSEGSLFQVLDTQHRTPGNKRSFVVCKMRSLEDGRVHEKTFRGSADHPESAEFEQRTCQFLYSDQDGFHFMDLTTYDQFLLEESFLGLQAKMLVAEAEGIVSYWNGKPVGVDLPSKLVFTVTETMDDVAKGNTSGSITKEATLESGLKVQVPPFVKTGDKVRVNTETGEYVERA